MDKTYWKLLARYLAQNLMVVKTQPGLVSEYNKLASSEEAQIS